MNARGRLSLVVLAAWLGPILSAAGQSGERPGTSSSSHIAIQTDTSPHSGGSAEELLQRRLGEQAKQIGAHKLAGDLLGKNDVLKQKLDALPPEKLDALRKQLKAFQALQGKGVGAGQDSEALRQQAAKLMPHLKPLLESKEKDTPTPNDDQVLDALVQRAMKGNAGKGTGAAPGAASLPSTPRVRVSEPKAPGSKSSQPAPPPATEKRENPLEARMARQIANWAERLNPGGELAENPSWKRMLAGLNRYKDGKDLPGSEESLFGRLGIETRLPKFNLDNWSLRSTLPSTRLPDLSRLITTPERSGLRWSASSASVSGASSAGLWRGLFWVVAAGALGGLLWWFLSGNNPLSAAQGNRATASAWTVGAWPVSPEQVHTRQQLIQAFEHLSLLALGRDARNWNHQEIATHLAAEDSPAVQRQAVLELADLYENARYAPEGAAMSDTDLEAARRHLCFLAGVSA